jgi:hypothetical protein
VSSEFVPDITCTHACSTVKLKFGKTQHFDERALHHQSRTVIRRKRVRAKGPKSVSREKSQIRRRTTPWQVSSCPFSTCGAEFGVVDVQALFKEHLITDAVRTRPNVVKILICTQEDCKSKKCEVSKIASQSTGSTSFPAAGSMKGPAKRTREAAFQDSSRITAGAQPTPVLGLVLDNGDRLEKSEGSTPNQRVLLPWTDEGYSASTASPILINPSSLQFSAYPRNDLLAPKRGIHKSARRKPPLSSSRAETNIQTVDSAREPTVFNAEAEVPQRMEHTVEKTRRYKQTQAQPSPTPQCKKDPETDYQVLSLDVQSLDLPWSAGKPFIPALLPRETASSEDAALGGWRGGKSSPAPALAEPQLLREEGAHTPLAAEAGSDSFDDLLALVWGDGPTAVASSPPIPPFRVVPMHHLPVEHSRQSPVQGEPAFYQLAALRRKLLCCALTTPLRCRLCTSDHPHCVRPGVIRTFLQLFLIREIFWTKENSKEHYNRYYCIKMELKINLKRSAMAAESSLHAT